MKPWINYEPRSLKELLETSLQKSIVDTMNDSRERFKEAYGRLLTEEEAIYLTSYIRKALKEEGKADEDIKDLLESVKKGT
jgi:transcriptional antiterminator